ncbi:MAG: ribosome recycling factor [Proteobacteria bacterium]|jgi:ribosome recycling factor|nr:ribosome recycling factor [Pseudomonadota bacterium]
MIDEILADAKSRMNKSIEAVKAELMKIRTGRASTALLDHLTVDYYGTPTPLNQVASVSVADSRTLTVQPWEKTMIRVIEKSIMEANLGLNPMTAGETIRIPLPPLTEERRKEMTRVVRNDGENGRIAVRNIRRDANTHLKELLKEKEINEDEEKRAQDQVQGLTDESVAKIDLIVSGKETEVMEV